MSKTLAVAKYLNGLNVRRHGCGMDEMKMHKMMYFSQRESLMDTDNPLFEESFEAWKFGPVLRCVRNEYKKHSHMFEKVDVKLTKEEKKLCPIAKIIPLRKTVLITEPRIFLTMTASITE